MKQVEPPRDAGQGWVGGALLPQWVGGALLPQGVLGAGTASSAAGEAGAGQAGGTTLVVGTPSCVMSMSMVTMQVMAPLDLYASFVSRDLVQCRSTATMQVMAPQAEERS